MTSGSYTPTVAQAWWLLGAAIAFQIAGTVCLRLSDGLTRVRDDGRSWQVEITGAQGSGILRSMSRANGIVLLHHEQGNVAAGDEVDVIPFEGLI